jgi:dTDP-4-dehydrorhamnose 3,5-epimerase
MLFRETPLFGAWVIEPEQLRDTRGYFARIFCVREFEARGLNAKVAQCSNSYNERAGTLRGMHFQVAPNAEVKLVRCTQGRIHDVILDLRADSATYKQWFAIELSAENGLALYVPEGFAHGFLTLSDKSEVYYQMSEFFEPKSACGVRWNDPAFGIQWPKEPTTLSERDVSYPDFVDD